MVMDVKSTNLGLVISAFAELEKEVEGESTHV
jgi:hypothetical protein